MTAVVGSMPRCDANQAPDCQHLRYEKLKIRVISRISCLSLAKKIWQVFGIIYREITRFSNAKVYCQEAFLQQRINQPNTSFFNFCAKFLKK